jgi:hypothetical protein
LVKRFIALAHLVTFNAKQSPEIPVVTQPTAVQAE